MFCEEPEILFQLLIHLFGLFIYLWMECCQQFCLNPQHSIQLLCYLCYKMQSLLFDFGNLCNFYILSLNNCANPSTNVPSVIATKCVILDNLSQTTRIASFPATNSNFIIKSTVKYIHGFFSISLNFNFSASTSVLFFIH